MPHSCDFTRTLEPLVRQPLTPWLADRLLSACRCSRSEAALQGGPHYSLGCSRARKPLYEEFSLLAGSCIRQEVDGSVIAVLLVCTSPLRPALPRHSTGEAHVSVLAVTATPIHTTPYCVSLRKLKTRVISPFFSG